MNSTLPDLPLPDGVSPRYLPDMNGLNLHVLTAGEPGQPCILLLHGFPELAFSWRKIMSVLAEQGYFVVAPDQRGYGRTTGWDDTFEINLAPFSFGNLVTDVVALLKALEVDRVHLLAGHDFGSPVAAYTALFRPDLLERLVLMSAPFGGAPGFAPPHNSMADALLALDPPRKHYQWYFATGSANKDMMACDQGTRAFLEAYYYMKSADWADNHPHPLAGWKAEALAAMPHYYVMPADQTMPEVVATHRPESGLGWLPNEDLSVYSDEYSRTGFQGGLNWYRTSTNPDFQHQLAVLHGKQINLPTWYIAGAADWGIYQTPGALDRMQSQVCSDFRGKHLLPGAGHWVQQEQPKAVAELLLEAARSA